jgi:nucleotide-binding universal stress UspA family protein
MPVVESHCYDPSRPVLVLLSRPQTTSWILSAAGCLSDLLGGAGIWALLVKAPEPDPPLLEVEVSMRRFPANDREEEQGRCAAVRRAFDTWLRARSEWRDHVVLEEVEELIDAAILERGRYASIIILEKAKGDRDIPQRVAIGRALLESGRPVVVMPHRLCTVFGRRIAILWRDGPTARKAVMAAIPWLLSAESVDVISVVRPGKPAATLPPVLAENAVTAGLHQILVTGTPSGRELMVKIRELDCDMVIMGAYGHSALRELLLGSFTDRMLTLADRPTWLCH